MKRVNLTPNEAAELYALSLSERSSVFGEAARFIKRTYEFRLPDNQSKIQWTRERRHLFESITQACQAWREGIEVYLIED